jgi:hypothetical protein
VRLLHWVAPLLVALHLPVFLLSSNIHIVLVREAYEAIALSVALAALALVAAHAGTRARAKTIALASGLAAWFFWFRPFAHLLQWLFGSAPVEVGQVDPAFVPWAILGLSYVLLVLRLRSAEGMARAWFAVAVVLLALPAMLLVRFQAQRAPASLVTELPAVELLSPSGRRPDIVYFVFDRYGGPATLREWYGFDNSGLIAYLRERGFHVAEHSAANYQRTAISLAATLNHDFIHELFVGMEEVSDWRPLYGLVTNQRAWRSLSPLGYEFVNVGAWWQPTRHNRHAHVNLSFAPVPIFFQNVYDNTALAGAGLSFGGFMDPRLQQWARVRQQARILGDIRRRPQPLFVLAHFLLPHGPYVFGPQGEFLAASTVRDRTTVENYVNHVRFANVLIRRMVDALLAEGGDKPPPIIVLQADEGPIPLRDGAVLDQRDWRQARPEDVRQKFGILNAVYLPGVAAEGLHAAMTPVNTFRIIFNAYFGARLPLRPDRSFGSVNDDKPYHFFEVTQILNGS